MTTTTVVAATVAGAAGALVRHELTRGRHLRALHAVNVVGSLLLGVAVGFEPSAGIAAVVVGGLGGLTSFSTWMVGAHEAAVSHGEIDDAEIEDEAIEDLVAAGTTADWRLLAGHVVVPALLAVCAAALGLLATLAARG